MQTLQRTAPLATHQPCRALHAARTVRPSVLALRHQRVNRGHVAVRTAEEKVVEQGACRHVHCGASFTSLTTPKPWPTHLRYPQPQLRSQACLVWPFQTPMWIGFQCWHPRTCQKVRSTTHWRCLHSTTLLPVDQSHIINRRAQGGARQRPDAAAVLVPQPNSTAPRPAHLPRAPTLRASSRANSPRTFPSSAPPRARSTASRTAASSSGRHGVE